MPSNQSIQDAPIQLNQLVEHVRLLTDLIYSTNGVPISTARQRHALLEMCDHLQLTTVRDTIWKMGRARLDDPSAIGLSPWESLKLGAIRDSPMLCVNALCALARDQHTVADICGLPIEYYEDMPCRYVATLLKDHYYKANNNYLPRSILDIADRFKDMYSARQKW